MKGPSRRDLLTGTLCLPVLASSRASHAAFRIAAFPTASSAVPFHAMVSGSFRNAGVDAQVEIVAADSDAAALLANGFDIVSGVHLLRAAALAASRRLTARFFLFHGYNARHLFDGLVARPDSGIRGLRDLAGRRVLVADAPANLAIVRHLLRMAGVPEGEMPTLLAMPQARFAHALRDGNADAAFTIEPWGTTLERFHGFPMVASGLLAREMFGDDEGLAFFGGALAAEIAISRHLDTLPRLRAAWVETYRELDADRRLRQRAVSGVFPETPIAETVGLPLVRAALDMDGTQWQQLQVALDMGRSLGVLREAADVTALAVII